MKFFFIWVRVYDVFLNKRGANMVRIIGNNMGVFIEYDYFARGKSMYIRVNLDIFKFMICGEGERGVEMGEYKI